MNNSINIAMLGGDRRQIAAIRSLSERYKNIRAWGIDTERFDESCGISVYGELARCLEGVDVAVLPLPSTVDGVTINAPLCDSESGQKLSALLRLMPKDKLIVGGRIPEGFTESARSTGHKVIDYFDSESLQIKNAYTTAEAALSIAMNTLDKNIRGARLAVTGYGRIAKHLCGLLLGIGADVCVAARDPNALCWAESTGCHTLLLDAKRRSVAQLQSGYDMIFNTVPFWLFDREFLVGLDKRTYIIDLASAPGGVDIKAARELGSRVNWATSLPGKYAPASAGEHIAECVDGIIRREVGLW